MSLVAKLERKKCMFQREHFWFLYFVSQMTNAPALKAIGFEISAPKSRDEFKLWSSTSLYHELSKRQERDLDSTEFGFSGFAEIPHILKRVQKVKNAHTWDYCNTWKIPVVKLFTKIDRTELCDKIECLEFGGDPVMSDDREKRVSVFGEILLTLLS